ncbi:MAG: DUF202 domain-containing protein [Candidatus Zixiibacteriota bacterium]
MNRYDKTKFEELTLRDLLALDRTKLANSRTFLAYLRTAIVVAVSAITLIGILHEWETLQYVGYALIPISIFIFACGAAQYFRFRARINLGETQRYMIHEDDEEN